MIYTCHAPGTAGVPAPAPTPEATASWAVAELGASTGAIVCHPADAAALARTLLAARIVVGSPAIGLPQRGTLWHRRDA